MLGIICWTILTWWVSEIHTFNETSSSIDIVSLSDVLVEEYTLLSNSNNTMSRLSSSGISLSTTIWLNRFCLNWHFAEIEVNFEQIEILSLSSNLLGVVVQVVNDAVNVVKCTNIWIVVASILLCDCVFNFISIFIQSLEFVLNVLVERKMVSLTKEIVGLSTCDNQTRRD